jgi:Kef-type K+ transport system membrane component KefB
LVDEILRFHACYFMFFGYTFFFFFGFSLYLLEYFFFFFPFSVFMGVVMVFGSVGLLEGGMGGQNGWRIWKV